MKHIDLDFFPGGVKKAVTFSYDDGRSEDRRLVELFNKYSLKATFHINCLEWRERYDFLKRSNAQFVEPEEYAELYRGHELSCHLASHPFTYKLPAQGALGEVYNNKVFLESLCDYPVRGLSYPFGSYTDETVEIFKAAGMEYGRTAGATHNFALPTDLMRWDGTCHHSEAGSLIDAFFAPESFPRMRLFNIWGHSYEFSTEERWADMESVCSRLAFRDDVWYATYIEIADYLRAMKSLVFTAELGRVYNPTAIPVWISVDDEPVKVMPGQIVSL